MSSNEQQIIEKYTNGNREDGRAAQSRTSSLEFHYTKKHLAEYIRADARILEVGCGTGHYGMYYADKCREYVGIDLVPAHIGFFREKIAAAGLTNVSCRVGDATDLCGIADGSFDVVLCLGPVYHLPPEEAERVFAECRRVCRTGGILAFAYIAPLGVYAGGCIYDDWRDIYPNEKANEFVLEKGTDDLRPGLFYFATPEEMEARAQRCGLEKLKNRGTDFLITRKIVDDMSEERFAVMRPLCDAMAESESCTGMSNHALLVCRKV